MVYFFVTVWKEIKFGLDWISKFEIIQTDKLKIITNSTHFEWIFFQTGIIRTLWTFCVTGVDLNYFICTLWLRNGELFLKWKYNLSWTLVYVCTSIGRWQLTSRLLFAFWRHCEIDVFMRAQVLLLQSIQLASFFWKTQQLTNLPSYYLPLPHDTLHLFDPI